MSLTRKYALPIQKSPVLVREIFICKRDKTPTIQDMKKENNIALIDGQNLHLGTTSAGWKVDFARFRIYLRDKFAVEEAYIFLGFLDDENQKLYRQIQKAGFILEFREHNQNMKGKKK